MRWLKLPSVILTILIFLSQMTACSSATASPRPTIGNSTSTTGNPTSTPLISSLGSETPAPEPAEIGRLGNGSAADITWTPDGKQLVIGGSLGLYFYDGQTGKMATHVDTPTDQPYDTPDIISIASDGKQIVFTGPLGLWITDLENGRTTNLIHDPVFSGARVLFGLDHKKLAYLRNVIPMDGGASFWGLSILDANTGKNLATLIDPGSQMQIYSIKVSPNGHTLAAARADDLIYLFNMDTGKKLGVLHGHESDVFDIDFSPDGRYLASVSADATLRIWDVGRQKLIQTIRGFTGGLHTVAFTPDGKYILAQLPDGGFEQWIVDSNEKISTGHLLFKPDQTVKRISIQPYGTLLATLDQAGQVQVWDWSTGELTQSIMGFGDDAESLIWSPDGKSVASATECYKDQGIISIWKVHERQLFHRLETHGICDLAFSPDGNTLASYDNTGQVSLWDMATGYQVNTYSAAASGYGNSPLAFSPEGQFLAVAHHTLQLWPVKGSNPANKPEHETDFSGNPLALAFSPDGKAIALATDSEVDIYDSGTGARLVNWKPKEGEIRAAGFRWNSGNAIAILYGYSSGGFYFHDLQNGNLLYQLNSITSMSFAISPDGRLLAIGDDYNPMILDARSGATLWNAQLQIWNQISFSPDGNTLATIAYGNTVSLWDVRGVTATARQLPLATATSAPVAAQPLTPTSTQPALIEIPSSTPPTPQPGAIQAENLSKLSEVAHLGKGELQTLAWSSDNTSFAVSTSLGVYLYAVQPFHETRFIEIPGGSMSMALSPTGDMLITDDLTLWDTGSGKQLYQLQKPTSDQVQAGIDIDSLRFSPDGNWIEADYWGTVCTWKVGQTVISGCKSETLPGRHYRPLSVSPDGHLATYISSDAGIMNSIQIVDTTTGSIVLTLKDGDNQVDTVLFSPDGQTLAFVSHQETQEYSGGISYVNIGNSSVELWHINTDADFTFQETLNIGKAVFAVLPPSSVRDANLFAFSSDSTSFVNTNGDNAMQVWNIRSGRLLYSLADAGDEFFMSPDGNYVLTTNLVNNFKLLHMEKGSPPALLQSVDGFNIWIGSVAFSADNQLLLTGDYRTAQLWDLHSGLTGNNQYPVNTFDQLTAPLALSQNGELLAGQVKDGDVQVWNMQSRKIMKVFQAADVSVTDGIRGYLNALAFSPDGQILATAGGDHAVKLWYVKNGQLLRKIDLSTEVIIETRHVIFSPNGQYLVASGYDNMEVWDINTGKQIRFFDNVGSEIAFAPNGVQVVSCCNNGKLFLLDLRNGQAIWTATASGEVGAVTFSPDGNLIATINQGTIQFWNSINGTFLNTLPGIANASALGFSSDGKTLAIGTIDGTVHLFATP